MHGNMTNLFMPMVNRNAYSITIAKRADNIRIGSFSLWPDHNGLADSKAAGTINDAYWRLRHGGRGDGKRGFGVHVLRLPITKPVKRSLKRA